MSESKEELLARIEREKTERAALEARVAARLKAKGIRLSTSACGCCEGVTLSLEVDGELIVDEKGNFDFSNFDEKPSP